MNLLKKGMLFLFAATLFVACSDDDDDVVTPVTPEEPANNHPLAGTTWTYAAQEGALIVGPDATGVWWQNSGDDVSARACLFDDTMTFNADNTYTQDLCSETWLEPSPHGVDAEGCGAVVAPWDGSNAATWTADTSTVTVVGDGAFIGLAKVHGTGEDGNPVDDTITYNYTLDGDNLQVSITGFHPEPAAQWTFNFTKVN